MTLATGAVLTYIGHTDACKEDCGWPCCAPGTGCPWEERVGKKATVLLDEERGLRVSFEGEPGEYWIRYRAHLSQEGRQP